MSRGRVVQGGFAAIAAIFLLTVLAGMGAFMVSFSNTQQLNSARDMQSTRAYWAARAGLEWALASVKQDSTVCPTVPTPFKVDTGATFTISVSCSLSTYQEGSTAVSIFALESRASTGTVGSIAYVERSVSASVEVQP
jgi:MSHA biogenesis protein MshP